MTLYLRPDDESLLRAYQAQYRRDRGEAISLGEIVGLLLRAEWPGKQPVAPGAVTRPTGPDREMAAEMSCTAPLGACTMATGPSGTAAEEPGAMTGPGDLGAAEEPVPGWPACAHVGEASGEPEGRVCEAAGGTATSALANQEVGPGAVAQMAARRTVEVVVRVAELGKAWLREFKGVLPLGIADTFKSREAIVLGDLYVLAVQAAARCRTNRIPGAVRKFVALRAGLLCEVPGCGRPVHDLHHERALADGGSHHPDNVKAACRLHHGMVHHNLFADLATGVPLCPGDPGRPTPADRAFQAVRARIAAAPS